MIVRFAHASVSALALAAPAFAQQPGHPAGTQPQVKSGLTQQNSPPQSSSQASSAGTEIVVTAQRRAESVQKVPIPVTVVSGEQLRAQGVQEISDLGRTTSSLRLAENPGGSGGGGYIRGIGSFVRSRAAEPSVGIVVDGVVQGLTNIRNLSDVARVEVLRGPQGTLFGQSVSAGVINITTNAPDPHRISGQVSTDLSFDNFAGSKYGKQQVRGWFNVPVASDAALRVSGYRVNTQGVVDNIFLHNKDFRHEWGVRGRFLAHLGPSVALNLEAEYNDERRGNGYGLTIFAVGLIPTVLDPATGFRVAQPFSYEGPGNQNYDRVVACGQTPSLNNFEQCGDAPSIQTFKTQGYSGQLDVDLGSGLTLTSITAYRKLDTITQNDIDTLPEAVSVTSVHSGLISNYNQFTQEVRLASDVNRPLSFTLGGFYFNSRVDSIAGPAAGAYTRAYTRKASLPIATCFPVATNPLCNVFVTRAAFNNYQNWFTRDSSAFGELHYHVGKLTVFGGGRYTHANVGFDGKTLDAVTGALLTQPANPAYMNPSRVRLPDDDFSWRVGSQFQANHDLMFFATVARGYKNAQIAPLQNTNPANPVKAEKPTAWDLGVKSTWLNGRLLVNLDGFYTDDRNYQGSTCLVDPTTQSTFCVPFNIPRVISKGIEADIFGRIGTHLTLNANLTYNIVRYPSPFRAQDGTNLGGQQLPNAPKLNVAVYTDYNFVLTGDVKGFFGLDLSHKSPERLSDISASTFLIDKPRTVVGLRAGTRVDHKWSLAVFANNIFNTNVPQSFSTAVNQNGVPNELSVWSTQNTSQGLREVGLQASLDF